MEYMHQKNYIDLESFDFEKFNSVTENVLDNSAELRTRLSEELVPLREKAKENAFLAMELLEH